MQVSESEGRNQEIRWINENQLNKCIRKSVKLKLMIVYIIVVNK